MFCYDKDYLISKHHDNRVSALQRDMFWLISCNPFNKIRFIGFFHEKMWKLYKNHDKFSETLKLFKDIWINFEKKFLLIMHVHGNCC